MSVEASAADSGRFIVPARYTAVAALLCGVHCAAAPVIAGVLPFLAVDSSVEWGTLGLTAGVGGAIVVLGPSRGRRGVLLLIATGMAVWAGSLLGLFAPIPESVTSPVGSLVFAAGMIQSARTCRSGECDRCSSVTQSTTADAARDAPEQHGAH